MHAQPEPPVSEEGSKLLLLESLDNDDEAKRPWTVVSKGRKKSRDRQIISMSVQSVGNEENLTPVKDPVIAKAEQQLMMEEKD